MLRLLRASLGWAVDDPNEDVLPLEAPGQRVRRVTGLGRAPRRTSRGLPHVPPVGVRRPRRARRPGGPRRRHGDRPGIPGQGDLPDTDAAWGRRAHPGRRRPSCSTRPTTRAAPATSRWAGASLASSPSASCPPARAPSRPCSRLASPPRCGRRPRRAAWMPVSALADPDGRAPAPPARATAGFPHPSHARATSRGGPRSRPLHYRLLLVSDRDPSEGGIIFRLRRRGDAVEAAVVEQLVPDRRTGARLVHRMLRDSGADYAIGLRTGRSAGLLPLPGQGPLLTTRPLAGSPPRRVSLGDSRSGTSSCSERVALAQPRTRPAARTTGTYSTRWSTNECSPSAVQAATATTVYGTAPRAAYRSPVATRRASRTTPTAPVSAPTWRIGRVRCDRVLVGGQRTGSSGRSRARPRRTGCCRHRDKASCHSVWRVVSKPRTAQPGQSARAAEHDHARPRPRRGWPPREDRPAAVDAPGRHRARPIAQTSGNRDDDSRSEALSTTTAAAPRAAATTTRRRRAVGAPDHGEAAQRRSPAPPRPRWRWRSRGALGRPVGHDHADEEHRGQREERRVDEARVGTARPRRDPAPRPPRARGGRRRTASAERGRGRAAARGGRPTATHTCQEEQTVPMRCEHPAARSRAPATPGSPGASGTSRPWP